MKNGRAPFLTGAMARARVTGGSLPGTKLNDFGVAAFLPPTGNAGAALTLPEGSPTFSGARVRRARLVNSLRREAGKLRATEIPDGMAVCHRCDVPSCINVDHLFLGTIADNNADKLSKGRNVSHPGERNGRAILSAEQIAAIRADARKQVDIAREYGIRQGYVSRIKNGRIWRGQDDNEARGAAATPPAARG